MSGNEESAAAGERRRSAEKLVNGTVKNNLKRRRRELIRLIATQEQLLKDAERAARQSCQSANQQQVHPTPTNTATTDRHGELARSISASTVASRAALGSAHSGAQPVSLSNASVKSQEESLKENVTWVPGLPFPAEYYVRVTRHKGSASSASAVAKQVSKSLIQQSRCSVSNSAKLSPQQNENYAQACASASGHGRETPSPLLDAQTNLSFSSDSPVSKYKPFVKTMSPPAALSPKPVTEVLSSSSSLKRPQTPKDSLPKELLCLLADASPTDPLPGSRRRRQVASCSSLPKAAIVSIPSGQSVRQFFPSPELLSDACDLKTEVDFALPDTDGFGRLKLLRISEGQSTVGLEVTSSQGSCSSASTLGCAESESVLVDESEGTADRRSKHRKIVRRRKVAQSGDEKGSQLTGSNVKYMVSAADSQQGVELKVECVAKSPTNTSEVCEVPKVEENSNSPNCFQDCLCPCEQGGSLGDSSVFVGDRPEETLAVENIDLCSPHLQTPCTEMPASAASCVAIQPGTGDKCVVKGTTSLVEQCSLVHSVGDGQSCCVQSFTFASCEVSADCVQPVLVVAMPHLLVLWQAAPQAAGKRWCSWEVLQQWHLELNDELFQVQAVTLQDGTVVVLAGGQFSDTAARVFMYHGDSCSGSFSLVCDDPLYRWPDVELRKVHCFWLSPGVSCTQRKQLYAVSAITDSALDEVVITKWTVDCACQEVCSVTSLPSPCNPLRVTSFCTVHGDEGILVATSVSHILVWNFTMNVLLQEVSLACCLPSGLPHASYAAVEKRCLFLTVALTKSQTLPTVAVVLAVDLRNGKATCIHTCQLECNKGCSNMVAFATSVTSCGLLLAAGLSDSSLLVWNLQNVKPYIRQACQGCPSLVHFHEKEPLLAASSSSNPGQVQIFHVI